MKPLSIDGNGHEVTLDEAVAYLESVEVTLNRRVAFGNWCVVASSTTKTAATLRVYRVYDDGTPMVGSVTRQASCVHQASILRTAIGDTFRHIFLKACSEGYPARFAGYDQMIP